MRGHKDERVQGLDSKRVQGHKDVQSQGWEVQGHKG